MGAKQKETKFFADYERYKKGILHYKNEHFSSCLQHKAIGEIDPDYMFFENALERIRKHIDINDTKFIFVLRNPIDRAYSHYLMTYRRGLEDLSFDKAVEKEKDRLSG